MLQCKQVRPRTRSNSETSLAEEAQAALDSDASVNPTTPIGKGLGEFFFVQGGGSGRVSALSAGRRGQCFHPWKEPGRGPSRSDVLFYSVCLFSFFCAPRRNPNEGGLGLGLDEDGSMDTFGKSLLGRLGLGKYEEALVAKGCTSPKDIERLCGGEEPLEVLEALGEDHIIQGVKLVVPAVIW